MIPRVAMDGFNRSQFLRKPFLERVVRRSRVDDEQRRVLPDLRVQQRQRLRAARSLIGEGSGEGELARATAVGGGWLCFVTRDREKACGSGQAESANGRLEGYWFARTQSVDCVYGMRVPPSTMSKSVTLSAERSFADSMPLHLWVVN